MDGKSKSVRVRFEEKMVCDYTNVNFISKHPECRMTTVSVSEDFSPDNVPVPHLSFIIERDADVPSAIDNVLPDPYGHAKYDYNYAPYYTHETKDDKIVIRGINDRTMERYRLSQRSRTSFVKYKGNQAGASGRPVVSSLDKKGKIFNINDKFGELGEGRGTNITTDKKGRLLVDGKMVDKYGKPILGVDKSGAITFDEAKAMSSSIDTLIQKDVNPVMPKSDGKKPMVPERTMKYKDYKAAMLKKSSGSAGAGSSTDAFDSTNVLDDVPSVFDRMRSNVGNVYDDATTGLLLGVSNPDLPDVGGVSNRVKALFDARADLAAQNSSGASSSTDQAAQDKIANSTTNKENMDEQYLIRDQLDFINGGIANARSSDQKLEFETLKASLEADLANLRQNPTKTPTELKVEKSLDKSAVAIDNLTKTATKSSMKGSNARGKQKARFQAEITDIAVKQAILDAQNTSLHSKLTNDAIKSQLRRNGATSTVDIPFDTAQFANAISTNMGDTGAGIGASMVDTGAGIGVDTGAGIGASTLPFNVDVMAVDTTPITPSTIPKKITDNARNLIHNPAELPNMKIPFPPNEYYRGSASFEFEMNRFTTDLTTLYHQIDTSKMHNQDKALLKQEIELSIEQTKIQAEFLSIKKAGGMTELIDITGYRELQIRQRLTAMLRLKPVAERPSFSAITGDLTHGGVSFNDKAFLLMKTSNFQKNMSANASADLLSYLNNQITTNLSVSEAHLDTSGRFKPIELHELNVALDNLHVSFATIAENHPHIQDINTSNTFKITAKPTISKFQKIKTMAKINPAELGVGVVGLGVGTAVGMLVGDLLQRTGFFEGTFGSMSIGMIAGGAGGIAGALTGELALASATRFAALAMPLAARESSAIATAVVRNTMVLNVLKGALEGAVMGAALVPIDIAFQDWLIKQGFTHAEAGGTSGAVIATTAVAIQGIGTILEGAAFAPETFGVSLAMAIGSVALSSGISFYFGQQYDNNMRDNSNELYYNRRMIIENLKNYNYDLNMTISVLSVQNKWFNHIPPHNDWDFFGAKPVPIIGIGAPYKDEYGVWQDPYNYQSFLDMMSSEFQYGNPYVHPAGRELTGDDKIAAGYMYKETMMEMKRLADIDGNTSVSSQIPYDPLTQSQRDWLDRKSNRTWVQDVKLQGGIHYESMKFVDFKINEAEQAYITNWNVNQTRTPAEIPTNFQSYASWVARDPNWEKSFNEIIMIDSQNRIIQAYQNHGVMFDDNPDTIKAEALRDPAFHDLFTTYTTEMEDTAARYHITRSQLIGLQMEKDDAVRTHLFQAYQFEALRMNTQTVDESFAMDTFMTNTVLAQGFYSIDQYQLDEDPEYYATFDPMKSQIYQSHELGMTLRQYIDYLHQLGMGEAGSYNNLPEYTVQEIEQQRQADYVEFENELALSGHSGEYTYDPLTGIFTPVSGAVANDRLLFDPYLPDDFVSSHKSFGNMMHGLNESNQKATDDYNLEVIAKVGETHREYQRLTEAYNAQMFRTGGEYMLYDPETVIQKNIIVFKPVSENMNDYTFTGDTTVKPVEPPPRFGVDDNISSLLDAEHYRIAQEQIDRQTYETGRELSHNELMYIYKNVYNQQYYESQAEQNWVSERRQKLERFAQANEGLDANSATDLDRANNLNMALEDYYTWINTFDVGFEIIPKPPKDEEEEEEEEKVVGYKGYLGSDGKPLTKAEMMRINDEQMRARGYRNLDDYYVDHPEARPPDNMA
jgi:hypothetical protein